MTKLTAAALLELAAELIRPEDPIEVRVGSLVVLAGLRRLALETPDRDLAGAVVGLPIVVDEALPPFRLEVRARDGRTLTGLDLEIVAEEPVPVDLVRLQLRLAYGSGIPPRPVDLRG